MKLYRLSLTRFAKDLTGEGARLFGGRWNEPGTPCIYTSETRALAILEYAANISLIDMTDDLSIICFDLPVKNIPGIHIDNLPANWADIPAPLAIKQAGTKWLLEKKQLAIKVPSIIAQGEYNVLLNPRHPDISKITIDSITEYSFDIRIKK